MSLQTHLDALYTKHASLEEQIHDAYAHHQDDEVAALKKKRLVIKDEINELVSQRRLRKAG
jgi:hypothetical protein